MTPIANKKKILIVSRSFYPMSSPRSLRTTELVKEFAQQGHEVTLLTVKNDEVHIPWEKEYGVTIKDLGLIRAPDIKIDHKYRLAKLIKRAFRRALLLLFEYPDIELMFRVAAALRKESGYDLLISIAVPYPVHWGVAKARSENHRIATIWAADCGDPYYGLENDSFNKLFYFANIEKWFCRKADYITIPFEGAKSAYFREFHHKIRVIPQGLSFPKQLNISDNYAANERITFAYFGNIQSYLHYAVPFLKKLNSVNKDFTFIVYTKNKNLFVNNLKQKTLDKCWLRDYTERDVLLQELSGVDFLVHFPYQKGSQKSLKLIDYNFLNKPILAYRNDEYSDKIFNEFLEYNFENKMILKDFQKYKINNVCAQYVGLLQNNMQMANAG